jgi:hypothetical protein
MKTPIQLREGRLPDHVLPPRHNDQEYPARSEEEEDKPEDS